MQSLKLQVLWLNNSLGLAVNHQTLEGVVPLTPYYFWPVSEAWEQIKFELDSKPWLIEEERIKLLNLIVEVMNQWQYTRTLSLEKLSTPDNDGTIDHVTILGLP